MSEYKLITGCTVEDAPGIAKTNMSAFYEVPGWNIMWRHKDLPFLIDTVTKRCPHLLLTNREVKRHVKVIHVPTGEIVGYSRWILPESAKDAWLEAQTPEVSEEERERYEQLYKDAEFKPAHEGITAISDEHLSEWKAKYLPKGPYITLDYLACRPDHQQRGVSQLLLESGNVISDKLKMPISCYATIKHAAKVYRKADYILYDERSADLVPEGHYGTYDTAYLVRHPAA